MSFHKILIDEFTTTDYELVGIYSNLESYRLAYFLNKELGLLLKKSVQDIELQTKNGTSSFSHFYFDNEESDIGWHLVNNKSEQTEQNKEQFGFFDSVSVIEYLVPEFKKVDFLLKIENIEDSFNLLEIEQKISKIPQVSLLHTIDKNKLKSKNNLIF